MYFNLSGKFGIRTFFRFPEKCFFNSGSLDWCVKCYKNKRKFDLDGAKLVSRMQYPSSTPNYSDILSVIIVILVTHHAVKIFKIK